METRYDSYYEKELPYKMSLEELANLKYKSEEAILACLRQIGVDNVRVIIPTTPHDKIVKIPFMNLFSCVEEKTDIICKMVNNDNHLYNPLNELEQRHPKHWYHPYKIEFTPVEYEGFVERFYFSDFRTMLHKKQAKIVRTFSLY